MNKGLWTRSLAVFATAVGLGACVNYSPLDDLDSAPPPTDTFNLALYKNYVFLAKSFGTVGQAQYSSFDQEASISLSQTGGDVADLANTYADKALKLTRDELVDPEPSRDFKSHDLRDRLVRALAVAAPLYPRDAARAQADWDCWRLDLTVKSQAAAADQCRASLDVTLPRLESEAALVTAQKDKEAAEKKKAAEANGQPGGGAGEEGVSSSRQ